MIKIIKSKIFLIISILLITFLYFFYFSKNEGFVNFEDKNINNNKNLNINDNNNSTVFTNVEYNFSQNDKYQYILKGEQAILNFKNKNQIKLIKVTAYTSRKNGEVIKIQSDKADYFKNNKNIFFNQNVSVIGNNIKITSNNANFISKDNTLELFDNVIINKKNDTILCDKIIYNFTTRNIELEMKSKKKQIYGKRS